jgi:soluble lytic murein transglycosylase-like protein
MSPDPYNVSLAKAAAAALGLDPILVCAVVEQESGWNQWALRFEPAFKVRYVDLLGITDQTEAFARAFSWGLMQTMLESVREIGYTAPAAQLCNPSTGLEWGCRLLARKMALTHGDVPAGLQFWNGGGNPQYAAQVMARMANYR